MTQPANPVTSLVDNVIEKHGPRVTTFLEQSLDTCTQKMFAKLGLVLDAMMLGCKFVLGLLCVQTLAMVCVCVMMWRYRDKVMLQGP